jgi:ATP-dependent protease HslVU (ClpYQ) peptidase subunit
VSKDNTNESKKRIKQIVRQFSGTILEGEVEELIPEHAIIGTGYLFCFDPAKRIFIKINRGSKAFIVDENINMAGRILIYTFNGELVEIEPDELLYTGFD